MVKPEEPEVPAPFNGNVALRIFRDVIRTKGGTGEGALLTGEEADNIRKVLQLVNGVGEVTVNPTDGTVSASFSGEYRRVGELEKALQRSGFECETISPLEVVYRSTVIVKESAKVQKALKAVAGVSAVVVAGNDFKCFTELSIDLEAIKSAAASAGASGFIVSHDFLRIPIATAGEAKGLLQELKSKKYVLRFHLSTNELSVLGVKPQVTRGELEALLKKHGFSPAETAGKFGG